jgi:hypothetical protein
MQPKNELKLAKEGAESAIEPVGAAIKFDFLG